MAAKKEDIDTHRWVEHDGTWRYLAPGESLESLDAPAEEPDES